MSGKIFGVGAALMDILARVEDSFLLEQGSPKGGMTLISVDESEKLTKDCTSEQSIVAGGSACNTLVGISRLGGMSGFVGKIGDDHLGLEFKKSIEKNGVHAKLMCGSTATGRVVSLITPDAERTMFTYLGASGEMTPQDLKGSEFDECSIVHIEGYLAFNEPVFRAVLGLAKAAGAKISLDLASFEVVQIKEVLLREIIPDYIDILIANEDEAESYCGSDLSDEKILQILSQDVETAVLKLGSEGSYISSHGQKYRIEARSVNALDTTGAGDLWASGYLYGINKGWGQAKSAELGSIVAAEVVQVVGASIPDTAWGRISKEMKEL